MYLPLKASDFERRRLDNHMAKYSVHINIACCMFYVVANMHIIYKYIYILCVVFAYVQLFVSWKTRFGWQGRDHQQSNDGITRAASDNPPPDCHSKYQI